MNKYALIMLTIFMLKGGVQYQVTPEELMNIKPTTQPPSFEDVFNPVVLKDIKFDKDNNIKNAVYYHKIDK